MLQSLFAYGAFAEHQVHYSKFARLIRSQKPGLIRGAVLRLQCGYPILDLSNPCDWIEGTLFELSATESFWAILDELLGVSTASSPFQRQAVKIQIDNFSQTEAMVYCLSAQGYRPIYAKIPHGDWKSDLKRHRPLDQRLSESHRDYLKRLAQAKGRQLVPYKLDVYRDLMAMELIKDKGRRPALTPLGREVSLFIQ